MELGLCIRARVHSCRTRDKQNRPLGPAGKENPARSFVKELPGQHTSVLSRMFIEKACFVGRSPWTAADALVGLLVKTKIFWNEHPIVGPRAAGPGGPARTGASAPQILCCELLTQYTNRMRKKAVSRVKCRRERLSHNPASKTCGKVGQASWPVQAFFRNLLMRDREDRSLTFARAAFHQLCADLRASWES